MLTLIPARPHGIADVGSPRRRTVRRVLSAGGVALALAAGAVAFAALPAAPEANPVAAAPAPAVRLDPQHIYPGTHMLLARGVAEVNPNYFVFHPSAAGQTSDPQLIPYANVGAGTHTFAFDCKVDSRVWTGQPAPRTVEYELIEPTPGATKQVVTVPMGVQQVKFTSTFSGGAGWYYWVLWNKSNTLWVSYHCDVTKLS